MFAVHLQAGTVEVRDIPKPERPDGFAMVRLLAAGICNTDLELRGGYYNFSGIPGHEFVGEVVEGSRQWIGRRVVGEINFACHECTYCNRGLERHCPNRTVLGIVRQPGAFQEFFVVPEDNLFRVPGNVATDDAVFTEPLAAACEILEQVAIPESEPVAVLGRGKLGMLIIRTLRARGLHVEEFGRNRERPRAEYNWVVDATGSPEGLSQAINMTCPRGTVIMKSTIQGRVSFDAAGVIVNEITLVGSRCGRFGPALELLASGEVDVGDLVAATFPLTDAPMAFNRAAQRGTLKVLLKP